MSIGFDIRKEALEMPAVRRKIKKAHSATVDNETVEKAANIKPTTRRTRGRTTHARTIHHNGNGRGVTRNLYQKAVDVITNVDLDNLLVNVRRQTNKLFKTSEDEIERISKQWTLLLEMVKNRWDSQRDLPWRTVAAATAAIMYFVSPLDIIPDFIPVIGFLDDAVVLSICFKLIQHDLRQYAIAEGIDIKAYGL
jgi:uncharacterized membrane protein YkvA (DUF1232 family)